MYIDTHVHSRDFNERHKETIPHCLEVARDSGVDAIFCMPNTNPPIIDDGGVKNTLKIVSGANIPEVFYGIYLGITKNPEQVKRATEVHRLNSQVMGMKLYAGTSVGSLGVTEEEDQKIVYKTLSDEDYDGVLTVHCEKESNFKKVWDPSNPITHAYSRPEESEVESLKDQIKFAKEYGFRGKLHVAHISSPRAVEIVSEARANGMDISCAICPHHFIYDMNQMLKEDGLLWKMNPPLREPSSKEKMLQYLRKGKIDWIESDHAPHSLEDKTKNSFMSGIPGLAWWPMFEEYLRFNNFSDSQVRALTFDNINLRFGIDIKRRAHVKLKDRRADYSFDPYEQIAKELNWKP